MTHLEKLSPESAVLRETFSLFPTGVACIGAFVDGANHALVASSFTVGVSFDPPLVSFAVQNSSSTWPDVRRSKAIGVSVMADSHGTIARQIASRNKPARFDGIDAHVSADGALYLPDSPVWLECVLYSEIPAGDHHLVLLEVVGLGLDRELPPMVFHRSRFSGVRAEG